MRSHRTATYFALALLLLRAPRADAETLLDHLPDGALGFVAVNDLAATSDKLERLLKVFEEAIDAPPTAPLSFVKTMTGLGPGLDDHGDAMLAALPGERGSLSLP